MRVITSTLGLTALLLVLLIACRVPTPQSPTETPVSSVESLQPTVVPPTAVPINPTPQLVISLITATPSPMVAPATPTPEVTGTTEVTPTLATSNNSSKPPGGSPPTISNGPRNSAPPTTNNPRPNEIGNTAADAALVGVLRQCWNISDLRLLNGGNPAHREAFTCARGPLLSVVQTFPTYPLVHRVLAWGYYYKDNDTPKAISEYRAAANLYQQQSDRVGESEARMRLALLLMAGSPGQGCGELAQAANLDPTNDRAIQYYAAYNCSKISNQTSGGKPVAPPPSAPQVNLGNVRGKIVFKSDRDGGIEGTYVMDPDGRNVQKVTNGVYIAASQWEAFSPDHNQVAVVRSAGFTKKFGYNNDIWVTDPSGGSGRALANPADDYDPVWSPVGLFDGKNWLAFVSNRGDIAHSENQGAELWVMHPDGTNPLRLTCHGPIFSKHPSWSADAKQLVFYSNYPSGGISQIFVLDLSGLSPTNDTCDFGNTLKNLSNNGFNDSEPIWIK